MEVPPAIYDSPREEVKNKYPQNMWGQQSWRERKKNLRWTDDQMKALLAQHEHGASMKLAASNNDIPYSTFKEWCYGVRISRKTGIHGALTTTRKFWPDQQITIIFLLTLAVHWPF